MAVRAARGWTVSTASYLLLCSVTGMDPITAGLRHPPGRRGFSVCWKSFAAALWFERRRRRRVFPLLDQHGVPSAEIPHHEELRAGSAAVCDVRVDRNAAQFRVWRQFHDHMRRDAPEPAAAR